MKEGLSALTQRLLRLQVPVNCRDTAERAALRKWRSDARQLHVQLRGFRAQIRDLLTKADELIELLYDFQSHRVFASVGEIMEQVSAANPQLPKNLVAASVWDIQHRPTYDLVEGGVKPYCWWPRAPGPRSRRVLGGGLIALGRRDSQVALNRTVVELFQRLLPH